MVTRKLPLLCLALAACGDPSAPESDNYDCAVGMPYLIDSIEYGDVTSRDCPNRFGHGYADYYRFHLDSARPVTIQVRANTVDAPMYTALIDGSGVRMDSIAIYPGWPATMSGSLEPGDYIIAIGAVAPGNRAGYSLSSDSVLRSPSEPFFGCTVSREYTIGSEVSGALRFDDCEMPFSGYPIDRYDFRLAVSRRITIELLSEAFYEMLYVFDAAGQPLAVREGGGPGEHPTLVITLPAGAYSIGVTSWSYDRGSYTLRSR